MPWNWRADLPVWYEQDLSRNIFNDRIRSELYILAVAIEYGKAAKQKWVQKWFDKGKIRKLNSLIVIDSDGTISLSKTKLEAVMDYLAYNLDDDFRRAHAQKAREFASQFLLNKLHLSARDLATYFRSED
jgi:hypothetical protein